MFYLRVDLPTACVNYKSQLILALQTTLYQFQAKNVQVKP